MKARRSAVATAPCLVPVLVPVLVIVLVPVLVIVLVIALSTPAAAQRRQPGQRRPPGQGEVTLPLAHYSGLVRHLEAGVAPTRAPVDVVVRERAVEGAFHRGLLTATLTARLQVLRADGHVRVPILDGAAYLERVLLDGLETTPVKVDGMYTVGVDRPGDYRVAVRFYVGREQERFTRRLQLQLPPGGITRVAILVPEREIEPRLRRGALLTEEQRACRPARTVHGADGPRRLPPLCGTRLRGMLDASGLLDLSWTRRVTHRSGRAVQLEARLSTLYTVREAVLSGLARFELSIQEGEVDRVDLRLPAGAEVMKVTGDAVLQWQTRPARARESGRLAVLLRYLAQGTTRVDVHFQAPLRGERELALPVILPPAGVPLRATAGVQAPAGLEVKVARCEGARRLRPRDLPPELTELTRSPLLHGFAFTTPPRVALSVARNRQVRLTSTLIDALQAATVLTVDGAEVTKVKLQLRNNTRQYLRVTLPAGARLTHALLDGQPVRPAVAPRARTERGARGEVLLFSLRQSERVEPDKGRVHRVKPGETLGDLAVLYYTDPDKWRLILEHNRAQLRDARDLLAGQRLKIPSAGPVTVEESSFVLELSYRRRTAALGALGARRVALPGLDVDAMKVIWHLYLPASLAPLRFEANLTQYSAIRYDPLRRAVDFMREVLSGRRAWAGISPGGKYQSILIQRKGIFRAEARRRSSAEAAPAAFPLVGQRYRFKRLLPGRDRPTIRVTFASAALVQVIRWGALLLALAATLAVLGTLGARRRVWVWAGAAAVAVGLLVVAHHVPGIHRRLVWGVALGLGLAHLLRLVREEGPRLRALIRSPWRLITLATLRNLGLVLGLCLALILVVNYPLLLSSVTAVALAVTWRRRGRREPPAREGEELADAQD